MIENVVTQLLQVYPKVNIEHLKIEQNEYDEQSYEVSDEVKEMSVFSIRLTEQGKLESFALEMDEFDEEQTLPKEVILKKAKEFLNVFILDEQEPLYLSSMMDMDKQFWIDFVRKDPYLNRELPSSGILVRMNKNGVLIGGDIELEPFKIEEPKIINSSEEAKAHYLEKCILTPSIMNFDSDYIGGDDAYHFVYYVEVVLMYFGTGSEVLPRESIIEPGQYEILSAIPSTTNQVHELIGIPANFMKISDDGCSEIWGKEFNVENEYDEADILEIKYDETGRVSWLSGVFDEEEQHTLKSAEEALERAIAFLQSQYDNATERFRLLREAHELLLYDDEGENEKVYAYQFNFQQFEREVIVIGSTISIEVDSRSLRIITVDSEVIQEDLSEIAIDNPLPVEKVKEIYAHALEMELFWSKETDEDDESIIYKLIYLPEFPATVGHMRAIDAKTGRPWFIDASWMESLEE